MKYVLVFLVLLSSSSFAIVGGAPAIAGDVPGQVALVDLARTSDEACTGSELFCKQYCSGVLIAPRWVLTAAHCAGSGVLTGNLRVVAGVTDLFSATEASAVKVVNSYVHHQYGVGAMFNADIALLKLDHALALPVASIAEPAALAALASTASAQNDEVATSGWGRLSSVGDFPKLLQRVALDLFPDSVCEDTYNQASVVRYIASSMLCVLEEHPDAIEHDDAGDLSPYDEHGEGVCNYDSGGPLFFQGNGYQQVAGLTSFAPKDDCGSTTLPSVFTRVSEFAPWIEATGKEGGDNFGDLALTVTGDASTASGTPADVTIQLRNASGLPSGVALPATILTGAGFTVTASAGTLALKSTPARLNCSPVVGGFRCTSIDALSPSVSRLATFTVTPAAGNQVATITATSFSDASNNLVDYRAGNNNRQHRILFSAQPDVTLELSGFAQEVVNVTSTPTSSSADGRAWVMGKVANHSSITAASNIALSLAMSTGFQWEAWEGLDECTSEACVLPALGPGEERSFRIRVLSPDAITGSVRLSASAGNGDFPGVVSGAYDSCDSQRVSFNVISSLPEGNMVVCDTPPAAASGGGSAGGGGGGSLGWGGLLILGGLLVLRRQLH